MRYLTLLIILLISLGISGCATSGSGRDGANRTSKFKTKILPANFSLGRGGLMEAKGIQYQARAQCKGKNCTPEEAEVSFFLEPGADDVYLSERSLSLIIGDKRHKWRRHEWKDIYDSPPVQGQIISVSIPMDTFVELASSHDVRGNLAGQNFEWSYENREPIRTLLNQMKPNSQED